METVLGTGLLLVGLAVIGTQIQEASYSVRRMELELQAMALAEMELAKLDLGLVKLDSIDEVQEEEFGPRYPEFAWRLTTQETGVENIYLLTLEVLHQPRDPKADKDYTEGQLDFDVMETVFTAYATRATPQPVDLGEAFGLDDTEYEDLSTKLADLGIPGIDAQSFDLGLLGDIQVEDLLKILPLLSDVFHIDIEALTGNLPPGLLDALRSSGVLDDGEDATSGEEGEKQ